MPFCPNCGTNANAAFCPSCGSPIGAGPAAPPPSQAAAGGLTQNVACALCYVLTIITGVIFLVLEPYKNDREVRFNAFQAIFFGLTSVALNILLTVVSLIMPTGIVIMVSLLSMVIWLGYLAVWIYLIVRAYQGNSLELPVIGPIARQQAG